LTYFEAPALASLNEPEGGDCILLFEATDEPQRLEKVLAETHVDQPTLFEIGAQGEVIKFLAIPCLLATRAESSVTRKPTVESSAAKVRFSS
jgi:hypothetical protein